MKNELLLASILLGSPVSALTDLNITDTISKSKEFSVSGIIGTFIYPEILDGSRYIEQDGDWVKVPIKERVMMTLTKARYQPSYYDRSLNDYVEVEMDYEMTFKRENISDSDDTEISNTNFFVKKVDKNTYRMWDCDSSANCQSDAFLEFAIYNTPKGRILKIKRSWNGFKGPHWELNMFKKNEVLFEAK